METKQPLSIACENVNLGRVATMEIRMKFPQKQTKKPESGKPMTQICHTWVSTQTTLC